MRAVRRERLRAVLDFDKKSHRLLAWEINMLPPLFGRPRYDRASSQFVGLEHVEDDAIEVLGLLRKEAALSRAEAVYLNQLFNDRLNMERDREALDTLFEQWKRALFGTNSVMHRELPRVPRNVIAWSTELREQVEGRRRAWQSQRAAITQLSVILTGSIEAISVPEDAFDDMSAISD